MRYHIVSEKGSKPNFAADCVACIYLDRMIVMRSFMRLSVAIGWWEAFEFLDNPRDASIASYLEVTVGPEHPIDPSLRMEHNAKPD